MAANIQISYIPPDGVSVNRPVSGVSAESWKFLIKLQNTGDAELASGTLAVLYNDLTSGSWPTGLTITLSQTSLTGVDVDEELVIDVTVSIANTLPNGHIANNHTLKFTLDGTNITAISGNNYIDFGVTDFKSTDARTEFTQRVKVMRARILAEALAMGDLMPDIGTRIYKDIYGRLRWQALGTSSGGSGSSAPLIFPERTVFVSPFWINYDPPVAPFFNTLTDAISHIVTTRPSGASGTEQWSVIVYSGDYAHASPLNIYGHISVQCVEPVTLEDTVILHPNARIRGEDTTIEHLTSPVGLSGAPVWSDKYKTSANVGWIQDLDPNDDNYAATFKAKMIGVDGQSQHTCGGADSFVDVEAETIMGQVLISGAYTTSGALQGTVWIRKALIYSTQEACINVSSKKNLVLDNVHMTCTQASGRSIEIGTAGSIGGTPRPAFVWCYGICTGNRTWRKTVDGDGYIDKTVGVQIMSGALQNVDWDAAADVDGHHASDKLEVELTYS